MLGGRPAPLHPAPWLTAPLSLTPQPTPAREDGHLTADVCAIRLCANTALMHPRAPSIWRISVTSGSPGSGAPRTRRHEPVSQCVFASHTQPAPGSSLRLAPSPCSLGLAPAAHGERGQPCCRARPAPHGCEVPPSGICTHPELASGRGACSPCSRVPYACTAVHSPPRGLVETAPSLPRAWVPSGCRSSGALGLCQFRPLWLHGFTSGDS